MAKTLFLDQFEPIFTQYQAVPENLEAALVALPSSYDYIRLGHPLSCVLEWTIAKLNKLKSDNVISFSSKTVPILAILRKNLLANKNTKILYTGELPSFFDVNLVRRVDGYTFELEQVENVEKIAEQNS